MAKFELKIKAQEMRREGKSIRDIALILGVSRSTVSLWCNGIVLSEDQIIILNEKQKNGWMKASLKGALKNKNKKISSIVEAKTWAHTQLGLVDKRDLLIAGIVLYWAEGSKSESSSSFRFSNTDPRMIILICDWLFEFFHVAVNDLSFRIVINEIHVNRIDKVAEFWSELLKIPSSLFAVTFIHAKQKKVYENHDSHYGVLSLRVKKGTFIKYKVLALIEALILENTNKYKHSNPYVGVAKLVKAPHS